MLIVNLIRYIVGFVSFKATGGFPERFVNLCTNNRIPLWNLKNQQKCITANTTIKGYKNIRQCARRSGVRVRLVKKHGLPFFIAGNKIRKGFAIGMAVAVIMVALLSNMVWTISVEGNVKNSEEQVLAVFDSLGVKVGARRSALSASDIAYEAAKLLDDVSWASLNLRGSRAEIVIHESTAPPDLFDYDSPCNIVASDDGVITKIDANIGSCEVKPGDIVLKGELLISGVTENLDKSESFKAAKGKAFAKVRFDISPQIEEIVYLCQSNEKTGYKLFFLGLRIPFTFGVEDENRSTTESYLSNGETVLPVGIIKSHSYSLGSETELPYEYKALENAKIYMNEYKRIFECGTVLSQELKYKNSDDILQFYGELTVEKEIGSISPILIEKN